MDASPSRYEEPIFTFFPKSLQGNGKTGINRKKEGKAVAEKFHCCHSREGGNPEEKSLVWFLACAGMTVSEQV